MSEAGLPGLGLRLGVELLRGPNGIWFSATAADGRTVGVLRFEPDKLKAAGAVERLVERTVAARAGMLPGVLPVVDLVEDAGRIWLITAAVPVAETASRTEAMLLGPAPAPPSTALNQAAGGQAQAQAQGVSAPPAPAMPGAPGPGLAADVWRPAIDLTDRAMPVAPSHLSERGAAQDGGGGRNRLRILIGAVLVVAVIGAAVVVGLNLRGGGGGGGPTPALLVTGVTVRAPTTATPTGICHASLDMVAILQTNGGEGAVDYDWVLPGSNPVVASARVSGASPQQLHLTWQLQLHGKGTVTAVFQAKPGPAVAGAQVLQGSATLPYTCP